MKMPITMTEHRQQTAVASSLRMENFMSDNPAKREAIEQRAYEFYLARGCEAGRDMDDWLAAEKELIFDRVESRIEEIREPKAESHAPTKTKSTASGQPA